MDPARISVSALGRDVMVGDLYNYYTDDILKSSIKVPSGCVNVEQNYIPETERSFFFNQPARFKSSFLGINSHVQRSIKKGIIDVNQLWFADFLSKDLTEKEHDNEALVTALFRVVRRTETLNRNFIESKKFDYQIDSGGRATHLVEQVVYGTEVICCMRRAIDWRRETKNSAEENIYLMAKAYFRRIFGRKLINNFAPPAELEQVSCRILSSQKDVPMTEGSFRQSCEFLRNIINLKDNDKPAKSWRPIYIIRYQIPRQLEARIFLDKVSDKRLKIERKWHWILNESRRILTHPYLNQIPPIASAIYQFIDLLEPIEKVIKEFNWNIIAKKRNQEQVGNDIKTVIDSVLLTDIVNWLIKRRCEIDTMCSLLKGKQMAMYDMAEIESRPLTTTEKRARVFVLKVDFTPDPLMKRCHNLIGNQNPVVKIPVFPVLLSGKERLDIISKAFEEFSEEAHWCSNEKNNYQIGLVPVSSPTEEATIKTILYPAIEVTSACMPFNCVPPAAQSVSSIEQLKIIQEDSPSCQSTCAHNLKNTITQTDLKKDNVCAKRQNSYGKVSYLLMKTFCQVFND